MSDREAELGRRVSELEAELETVRGALGEELARCLEVQRERDQARQELEDERRRALDLARGVVRSGSSRVLVVSDEPLSPALLRALEPAGLELVGLDLARGRDRGAAALFRDGELQVLLPENGDLAAAIASAVEVELERDGLDHVTDLGPHHKPLTVRP